MTLKNLAKYRKVLIIGYGLEGKSLENFFKVNFPETEIKIADQKDGPDYLDDQANFELAVKSPGVNKALIKIPYTTATNIFFANAKAPIIGITGTKGKSTTTSLVHAILKEAGHDARLCGNIGRPMLDQLLEPVSAKTIYVAEISSYQLDDLNYSPHISVILNLFPEHLDYHGSFEAYKAAKKNIVAHATKDDYFVFNPDYPELVELAKYAAAKAVQIIGDLPFDKSSIPLIGEHNLFNVRAAYTVAKILGVEDAAIEAAVKKFVPLPHRLEKVGIFKGITFYDDSISTTPESAIQAINSIPSIDTIFLGGTDRGYNFELLAETILKKNIQNIVLFPDSGSRIRQAIQSNLKFKISNLKFFETRDMAEAVRWAYENTRPGYVCILSCASPSYSLWKNFEEKGNLFKKFVKEYS